MLRYLYFKSKYGSYLRNENGIKKFAELSIGQLVRKVAKKSSFYREMNENLLVEKANLRMRVDELHENPMLDPGEFFSVRRRLIANGVIMFAVLASSIFLLFLSISSFLPQDGLGTGFLNWIVAGLLAIVLIGGGVIISERLIESLVPGRPHRTPELQDLHQSVAPLWAALLVGIELALFGLSEARASQLAAIQESSTLYYGFIIMTMLLPLMAGTIRWDAMRFIDLYKATQAFRQIQGRLAQIDSILRQNEEYESNFYKIRSISTWELINDFKTYKDNYNAKRGYEELLGGHFAESYDAFQSEANKRYTADIRDVTTKSLRRLDLPSAGPRGAKLSQIARPIRFGEAAESRPKIDNPDLYLSPQPIR
jgi:hypothetical protein